MITTEKKLSVSDVKEFLDAAGISVSGLARRINMPDRELRNDFRTEKAFEFVRPHVAHALDELASDAAELARMMRGEEAPRKITKRSLRR